MGSGGAGGGGVARKVGQRNDNLADAAENVVRVLVELETASSQLLGAWKHFRPHRAPDHSPKKSPEAAQPV